MKICQECWEGFLANLFNRCHYVEYSEFKKLKAFEGKKAGEVFGGLSKLFAEKIICLIDGKNAPSKIEFERMKTNKDKYLFIRKRNHWIDANGFSHVI